jgi:hypothetical protein
MFAPCEVEAIRVYLSDRRHARKVRRRLLELLTEPANQARVEAWLARAGTESEPDNDLIDWARFYLKRARSQSTLADSHHPAL